MRDIRNFTNTRLLFAIVVASCIVDTVGLFIWRYVAEPHGPITKWYDQFGITAYMIDVTSIAIGVILTQFVTTFIGGPWDPIAFCAIAVSIQMVHDMFFSQIVVPLVPKGKNSVMDLMKEYSTMRGAGWVLVVDALYMVFASLLTMLLYAYPVWVSYVTFLTVMYVTGYILYTHPGNPTIGSFEDRGAVTNPNL